MILEGECLFNDCEFVYNHQFSFLLLRYLGIQQVVFGGRRMGDWEEGMTSTEDGYKSFKV